MTAMMQDENESAGLVSNQNCGIEQLAERATAAWLVGVFEWGDLAAGGGRNKRPHRLLLLPLLVLWHLQLFRQAEQFVWRVLAVCFVVYV